ncbi:M55 family metallopeptidase [Falsochrobactrum sp. TDYN1]|uniref:M55 family metallopeptidase n=1 Tax=Falsochrobactrum tianjinense TaxID=2706015 RepID=A0A949PNM3_9HYPH|nr:M55 family metallopeptidase [Falsochrobactrum sp. TDYN1]MBV2143794.1 M55 family metallopeptidase [Falsochrobactrum sp. TDYN1]
MKVFISADIEGTAGIASWDEARKSGPDYAEFREYMTAEVVAACEGARNAGAQEVVVKDGHETARNIISGRLPEYVTVIHGWPGNPHSMMCGLDDSFDAVVFTGYHAKAGSSANPLAHSFNNRISRFYFNGVLSSEFTHNSHIAAYHKVPCVFISGDAGICGDAAQAVPGIKTVAVSQGIGPASVSMSPVRARTQIRTGVEEALTGDLSALLFSLPDEIDMQIEYANPTEAYRCSWYPGAELLSDCRIGFRHRDFFEVMRAFRFIG